MKRYVFTVVAIISLLLFAATVAMWGRSYLTGDTVGYQASLPFGTDFKELSSARGRVAWYHDEWRYLGTSAAKGWSLDPFSRRRPGLAFAFANARVTRLVPWETLGFHLSRSSEIQTGGGYNRLVSRRTIQVPYWLPAMVLAILPSLWVVSRRRMRRRHRIAMGLCLSCGYDLRGTPQRCPECGTAPEPKFAGRTIHETHRPNLA